MATRAPATAARRCVLRSRPEPTCPGGDTVARRDQVRTAVTRIGGTTTRKTQRQDSASVSQAASSGPTMAGSTQAADTQPKTLGRKDSG